MINHFLMIGETRKNFFTPVKIFNHVIQKLGNILTWNISGLTLENTKLTLKI